MHPEIIAAQTVEIGLKDGIGLFVAVGPAFTNRFLPDISFIAVLGACFEVGQFNCAIEGQANVQVVPPSWGTLTNLSSRSIL